MPELLQVGQARAQRFLGERLALRGVRRRHVLPPCPAPAAGRCPTWVIARPSPAAFVLRETLLTAGPALQAALRACWPDGGAWGPNPSRLVLSGVMAGVTGDCPFSVFGQWP